MDKINKVGIIGGGKMGTSLFNYLTKFELNLVWHNRSEADKALQKHHRKLERAHKNELISNEQYAFALQNQFITHELTDLEHCQLIIECISEDKQLKQLLFEQLFSITNSNTIVATNSSSLTSWNYNLPKEKLARLVGLHFFYPVETKNLVEFIYTENHRPNTIQQIRDFLFSIDKFYIEQSTANALLLNAFMLKWQIEAFELSQLNGWSFLEMDKAIEVHLFPLGLFCMMDFIGLDLIQTSARQYQLMNFGIDKNAKLFSYLAKKNEQNQIGIKTLSGFHSYPISSIIQDQIKSKLIASALANSFFSIYHWTIKNQLCSEELLAIALNEYLDTEIEKWHKLL